MSDRHSPYNLFGLDLAEAIGRIKLGWRQLLWSESIGIHARFCPPVQFANGGGHSALDARIEPHQSVTESGQYLGWLVPEPEVLIRELTVPVDAEIYLDEIATSSVEANSPFDFERTAYGYRVADRSPHDLTVRVAMVSRDTAADQLRQASETAHTQGSGIELWASDGDSQIILKGFGESSRLQQYQMNLRGFIARTLIAMLGLTLVLSLPVLWMQQRAHQLTDLKADTQSRVGAVVATRGQLVRSQEMIDAAEVLFESYVDYGPWLHAVSSLTPDQVYFNRLGLEGKTLTVSGFAKNAADYQSVLTEAGLFTEVAAPSAFTRDERVGRERFTLTMSFKPAPAL